MAKLNGSITTIERVEVDVSPEELKKQTVLHFSAPEILKMTRAAWLRERGIYSNDVRLSKNSAGDYYFEEYENNGSHYSGYYDRPRAYRVGDEMVWDMFEKFQAVLEV